MKKYKYRISKDGLTINGLWTDIVPNMGEATVERVSKVEFNDRLQKWTVEILVGIPCSLAKAFVKRADALAAEVCYVNDILFAGEPV